MKKSALHYMDITTGLGLPKLATILRHMGKCVCSDEGTPNKILYVQFFRILSMELTETRNALKKY